MDIEETPLPIKANKNDSIEFRGIMAAAFEQLPEEIIEQILLLTSPNAFASLAILNRKWRAVSQQTHLYAHHLSRCPSYSAAHHAIHVPDGGDNLPELRRLFANEIKRNLFEAYLRPRETIISLVSTSISSSSAPGGEAFHFSLSPRGHYILAYNSSRIHIIDVTGDEFLVKRELKILRRPASATITDDGSSLAVLSTDLQIDLYDLTGQSPKHTRAVALDHTPRTIALSPTGSVLAAAYDAGVEVSSLDINYQNLDHRSVKCYAVDALSFSQDGTQLLGSTVHSRSPSTVILTAPYFDPGAASPEEVVSALWTTSILFPNGSRDCSHAVLLPSSSNEEANWTFTYDRVFETFRAVRIDDLRNGTTYFTGPVSDSFTKLLPSTLPTASEAGDLVASGFQGSIWLYGVPEDLEALPVVNPTHSTTESGVSTPASQLGRRNSAPSLRSIHRHRDSVIRTPQWQLLCDRLRNTFVEGRKVSSLDRVSAMAWVADRQTSSFSERLVAVAPGILRQSDMGEDDGMSSLDGGRISILDFDYSLINGEKRMITIEVGANEPEVLEEEHRDLDTEVAIVRRRTVAQQRGNRGHISRSATTLPRAARHDFTPLPDIPDRDQFSPSFRTSRRPSTMTTSTELSETTSIDEIEAFDAPYSQTAPRSQTTLRRAATAAASNRRFRPVAPEHIEYRRADGREEHPHESDADNWIPPPPPYSKDPVPPLPEHIQRSILAEAALATLQRSATQRSPILDFPGFDGNTLGRSRTVASTSSSGSRRDRYHFHRTFSDTAPSTHTSERLSFEDDDPRPSTRPRMAPEAEGGEEEDLYGVSPQNTPPLAPRRLSDPTTQVSLNPEENTSALRSAVHNIPRRPVATSANVSNDTLTQSPKPVMLATLQKPVSPIPEHVGFSPSPQILDGRGNDWEENISPETPLGLSTSIDLEPRDIESFSQSPVEFRTGLRESSQRDINKDIPPRPDSDHHLTALFSSTLTIPDQRSASDSDSTSLPRRSETTPVIASPAHEIEEDPIPIWRRTGTAPAASAAIVHTTGMIMPTSDQMARLNSRRGRPSSAADPRRMSGSSNHRPSFSGGSVKDILPWGAPNHNNTPPRLTPEQSFNTTQRPGPTYHSFHLPRPTTGQHAPPPPQGPSDSPSPSRRISSAPTLNFYSNRPHASTSPTPRRHPSTSPPLHLRPAMPRLETIHSIASTSGHAPESSPYFAQKQIMVARQPSRAERSAAKNMKDAKKRGWRASMMKEEKKKKKRGWEVASSAGWTDVTAESSAVGKKEKKEKKEGKCVLM